HQSRPNKNLSESKMTTNNQSSTQAVMSDSLESAVDAFCSIYFGHQQGFEGETTREQITRAMYAALLARSTGAGGEAASLLRHLKTAHAWLEEHVNGDASEGTIECNGVVWNIDESKAAIAAHELASVQPMNSGDVRNAAVESVAET